MDKRIVGALTRGDLSEFHLTAADASAIVANRISSPVDRALQLQPQCASPEASRLIHRSARQAAFNSLAMALSANQVADILASAGVRALVYKGVALAAQHTGGWRGRESVDVDVLIPLGEITRAHEALVEAGLTRRDGQSDPPSRFFRYHQIELGYSGLPFSIDLHWRLESPGFLDLDFDEMWRRRMRLDTDGLRVWTPAPAESLLISAVHGTRENWRSLRHVLDASMGLTSISVEQWRVVEELSGSGAKRSMAIALGVAHRCGVTDLPAQPGTWALQTADEFLSRDLMGRNPRLAVERRLRRWKVAGSPHTALDGLARSLVRQLVYRRSWEFTRPNEQHARANK